MGQCAISPITNRPTKIIDLDEILFSEVKKELTLAQTICLGRSLYLEAGWNYVDFSHKLVKFHIPKDKSANDYRNLTLFRTKFVNSSDDKQRYTFRTERQTKSSCSLSVQKGYTLGATTNLEFALPTNAAPGVEPCKISGGLSGQMSWSKTKAETHEETLTWSVDSQVEVNKKKTAYAALVVHEENFDAQLKLETTLRSTDESYMVPVNVRSTKDKQVVCSYDVPLVSIAVLDEDTGEMRPNFSYDVNERVVKITTEGTCKAVYGIEQVIQIETRDLRDTDALSASLLELNLDAASSHHTGAPHLNTTQQDDVSDDVTEKTALTVPKS